MSVSSIVSLHSMIDHAQMIECDHIHRVLVSGTESIQREYHEYKEYKNILYYHISYIIQSIQLLQYPNYSRNIVHSM